MREKALNKIKAYIDYAHRNATENSKRELYVAACAKIHLAFDLGLIDGTEEHDLIRNAAHEIL